MGLTLSISINTFVVVDSPNKENNCLEKLPQIF